MTIGLADPRFCTKCGHAPRVPGQRWCTACRTLHQRGRRAAALTRKAALAADGRAVASNAPGEALPDVPAVLQTPAVEALDRLREAHRALTCATRETDWRRSPVQPSTALRPLLAAVRQAEQACRALGAREAALAG